MLDEKELLWERIIKNEEELTETTIPHRLYISSIYYLINVKCPT